MRKNLEFITNSKQIEHYINGIDATDGMHPGIRSKCPKCHPKAQ